MGHSHSIQDLREQLIRQLLEIKKPEVLSRVKDFLDHINEENDFWPGLTDLEKADIEAGLADIKAGRKKPFEEILKKYR